MTKFYQYSFFVKRIIYYKGIVFLFLCLIETMCFAQRADVSVSPTTGSANAYIPIGNVSMGSLSAPVSLVYNSSGVKVKDVEGTAGIGWQLDAGGQISREVRGLPDDCKKSGWNSYPRLGWLYNTNSAKISSFSALSNDNDPNTCTDGTNIVNYLNSNFSDLSDTEPDIFNVSAPGLSFQFVFDGSQVIRPLNYQDLKIVPMFDTNTGAITSFTVTNNRGIVYTFDLIAISQKITTAIYAPDRNTYQSVPESSIVYFRKNYDQYKNSIDYASAWYLTGMSDANNNTLTFGYADDWIQQGWQPLDFYVGGSTKATIYWEYNYTHPKLLSSITAVPASPIVNLRSSNPLFNYSGITFQYVNNPSTNRSVLNSISYKGIKYLLSFTSVGSSIYAPYKRLFLRDVFTDQPNSPIKYHFDYTGETYVTDTETPLKGYVNPLPDSSSKAIDWWGYYSTNSGSSLFPNLIVNPANANVQRYQIYTDNATRTDYTIPLSGNIRTVNTALVATGTLSKITYLDNGSTSITYEPNDYYDTSSGTVVQGGGVRVSQVVNYDGISTANNIVRNYSYVDPTTGVTTGKPITLPVYAFTNPTVVASGTNIAKWTSATVRSEIDLSSEDHSIAYSKFTVSEPGAGKTVTEYYIPGTNWDNSASPACDLCTTTEWNPVISYAAAANCGVLNFLNAGNHTYPFAPETNYNFERYVVKKITQYNNDSPGTKVGETNFSYTRTGTPVAINALRADKSGTADVYSIYKIFASSGELIKTQTTTTYPVTSEGITTNAQSQSNTVSYFYNSANHKLPTQVQTTKSDGGVLNTYFKYVKDYTGITAGATDPMANALYNLQLQNNNQQIESITQLTGNDLTIKLISASLIKFKKFSFAAPLSNLSTSAFDLYLPSQKLGIIAPDGGNVMNLSGINANVFSADSRYTVLSNYLVYDYTGHLQSGDDDHKHVNTVFSDIMTGMPVASISNAGAAEVGFFDEDSYFSGASFNKDNFNYTTSLGSGRGGTWGLSLEPSAPITRVITKNPLTKNYIFSAWVNSSAAFTLNVTLVNSSNQSTVYPMSITAGTAYKYYELKIPVTTMSSTFTVKVTNASSANIWIDDILLYPETAEVSTIGYDKTSYATIMATNTNGVASYNTVDVFGRVKLVYDQDMNIKLRKSYNVSQPFIPFLDPVFTYSPTSNITTQQSVYCFLTNSYPPSAFPGMTTSWNFGDGTVATSSNVHQYTAAGTYTITVTVNAPGYGVKTYSAPITITAPPPVTQVNVTYSNNSTGSTINTVTFSQAGNVIYTFTASQLATGTANISPGVYTVGVNCSGSTFGSVIGYAGNGNIGCANYFQSNHYSFSMDLSNTAFLNVYLDPAACNNY